MFLPIRRRKSFPYHQKNYQLSSGIMFTPRGRRQAIFVLLGLPLAYTQFYNPVREAQAVLEGLRATQFFSSFLNIHDATFTLPCTQTVRSTAYTTIPGVSCITTVAGQTTYATQTTYVQSIVTSTKTLAASPHVDTVTLLGATIRITTNLPTLRRQKQ